MWTLTLPISIKRRYVIKRVVTAYFISVTQFVVNINF